MNRKVTISAIVMAAGVAMAGRLAFARPVVNTDNDAVIDLANTKLSLIQAVEAAEAHAGGKAIRAELDGEHGTTVYRVEVVGAKNKVFDVKVDSIDGKVLANTQDRADHRDKEDEDE
jgi:uncharacterized membrane protein YkoI